MYFNNSNGMSINPKQDFMWVAEYLNGGNLLEFNEDCSENSFYSIDKKQLNKFGLVGRGHKMFFDATNGIFNISGRTVEFEYVDGNKTYNLTNASESYNNIVQFKTAESTFDPFSLNGVMNSSISQFNFGYKQKLVFDDLELNFKVICKVPYDRPVYLEISLTTNKTLNGKLLMKRNGEILDSINAPIDEHTKGTLNWDII